MNTKLVSLLGRERAEEAVKWVADTEGINLDVAEGNLVMLTAGFGGFQALIDGGLAVRYPEIYACHLRQKGLSQEEVKKQVELAQKGLEKVEEIKQNTEYKDTDLTQKEVAKKVKTQKLKSSKKSKV